MKKLTVPASCLMVLATCYVFSQNPEPAALRAQASQRYRDGNYKDAYEAYRKLALDQESDPKLVGGDLRQAINCLQRLNRVHEIDAFREKVIDTHPKNWRLMRDAAQTYMQVNHWGYLIAGEFRRGRHRGGGLFASAYERDRVRAMQLMVKAMKLAENEPNKKQVAQLHLSFANMVMQNRSGGRAWRLQALTDLTKLPDYVRGRRYRGHSTAGAPVDADGNPVFHHMPDSFEKARTDGQRWRWLLAEAVKLDPDQKTSVDYRFASFWYQQHGVQTMASYSRFFPWGRPGRADDQKPDETGGAYAVHTLKDDETLAKLANGVKRFKLPDEFNYIRIFKDLAERRYSPAVQQVAGLYENRRQYDKAVEYWKQFRQFNRSHANNRISQILDDWGTFEPSKTHPAGVKPKIDYRFRNGESVALEAMAIDVDKLLADTVAYIKNNPQKWDWHKAHLGNIGYRLVHENEDKYIGESVAKWKMDLKPDPRHWDRRVTIEAPMTRPGAYLLKARIGDGNISRIIVWVNDTVIVRKPLQNQILYYVTDAVTGKPLKNAKLDFFGYRRERLRNVRPARYKVHTKTAERRTDDEGLLIFAKDELPTSYSWLVTASAGDHFAYSGFERLWYASHHDYEYKQIKSFGITDRPVYRPGQEVKFKVWTRHAKYDLDDGSSFAGQGFNLEIRDPKGKTIFQKGLRADEYGGVAGRVELPGEATLGVYRVMVSGPVRKRSAGHFRVEEYKKPEFEVTVEAPSEPVMLGEKITGSIQAKYYFGSPVTQATVKYKILRTEHDSRWFPTRYWDWLFQPGYWWFASDYTWYPGWGEWGCRAPRGWWWPRPHRQPEVVAEAEASIGPDGKISFEIDTALAKAIHGDSDHKYSITAEVRDQSRRTIVGTGQILVAREPFKVYAWVNRGHYRVGDTVHAHFKAQTLDKKPVQGTGKLRLLKIDYKKDGTPVETPVQQWDLNTDDEGLAQIKVQAAKAGQYRLSYKVTDAKDHTIEGGYIFMVRGAGDDGSNYRFNKLELITDRDEYKPGEKVRLMINADKKDATVMLFVRPSNGVYLPPEMVHLEGKSAVREIGIVQKDMPNIFVEAVTVYNGKLHTQTRQIAVPPAKRVIKVKVLPSKQEYKPGEKAKVRLQLTDYQDRPIVGSVVLSGYDRSVEYISGGSNVPEIREFFWKWRRRHNPRTYSTLGRWFSHLAKSGEARMRQIGVFGNIVAENDIEGGLGRGRQARNGG
ncbi:MAG: MG2 domain-containing protein, partial [Phycisphaeraceae bacterium]|nr:MG2 domain-containing protein [Phycisphaeraceae bacterium]